MIECSTAGFFEELLRTDKEGIVKTPSELKQQQFGIPLLHYAQQYLFGATGQRLRVFHSIAGVPASCKSPLLFDLMGYICAPIENGGLGGAGQLYELEDKISPVLLNSVVGQYGDNIVNGPLRIVTDQTLEGAFKQMICKALPAYKKKVPTQKIPLVIGMDSIGGAASGDVVNKLNTEGVAGKGYYDKAHFVKYFCENARPVMGDIPMVIICINQEKEMAASTPYGPPQKKITGGVSQMFKDGHMISANFKTLASGDGKVITLRTTKTSFCDSRKIEVNFRWNKFGTSQDDAYGHHFEWALASAKCLAAPDKGVGEIRDIADVHISDQNLVTCPQLDCKSVPPEEFEAALFAPEYASVQDALRVYQKIEKLKTVDDYAEFMKHKSTQAKTEPAEEEQPVKVTKKKGKAASKQVIESVPLYTKEELDKLNAPEEGTNV